MHQLGGGNIVGHSLPSTPTPTPGFWKTVLDTVDDIIQSFADGLNGLNGIIRGIPQTDPACFVSGTLIKTEFGEIPIEEIRTGDLVCAWDEEAENVALKEVVETYINKADELVHVFVNGEETVTTPAHPFYSPIKGWTDAVHLRAGDILVLVNGEYVVVEKVQHEILETPVTVYNFQVEEYHTYFVSTIGVLVHNSCAMSPVFDKNQQVVLDLAKEYKKVGMSRSEATILVDWAKEYGIDAHYPGVHPNRAGMWSYTEHINIRNTHIPLID